MITRRRVTVGLTALLLLDTLFLAWVVWQLNSGTESDASWRGVANLVAFLGFPLLVVSSAVLLEVEGWRAFRARRRFRPRGGG
ncbi:MAG: hypothetical protein H0V68_03485 [Actinobacteria bacterium]|nr:hypothetical protein [Actinomycetota bacterium]